jgi:hypothetical protein
MPTQDEKTAESIHDLQANTTILLGVAQSQGRDIKRIFQRLDTVDGRLSVMDGRLNIIDGRLNVMDGRLDTVEQHLSHIDIRLDKMDARFDKMDTRFDGVEGMLAQILTRLPEKR